MATRGEINLSCCSACLDDGSNTTARHYCVDCEMYFCTKCVKCHNTIPSSRKHQVNDVYSSELTTADDENTQRESESAHSWSCTLHKGKLIDSYCKEHNEVCCGPCAVIKHRSCTIESIATAAKDFKSSPEMNKCTEALNEDLIQLKQEKEKRRGNLEYIAKQKLELITNVDTYEEKMIAKIKELANTSRKDIHSKYAEHKTVLETEIEALDVVLTTNIEYIDILNQTDDDEQLFVYVKTNERVIKDSEMLLQAITTDWTKRELKFNFDEKLNRVIDMKLLGRLKENCAVEKYHATFERNINVKRVNDTQEVHVPDMCFMDSSDLLMTDHYNKKLKRFSSDLQFKDEILLSGRPVAVCKMDRHEVAVRIWNTKVVHIVSVVKTMQLTSSFTLAGDGYGMTYDAGTGELFSCEGDKVSVYSKTGLKLRTYDKDTNGEQIFSRCRKIAFSINKRDMYVTDYVQGLIVLDKGGHLKTKVSLSGVNDAMPLCLLPGHICLTGSRASGVFVQIDKDEKQVGKLLETNDGRTETFCAVYDREQSRLIIGGYPNEISIYTMSAK